jgi:hypothetical protein
MTERKVRYPKGASTKWVQKVGRLAPAVQAGNVRAGGLSAFDVPKYRDSRKPLHCEITFVGGAESTWEVKSRGVTYVIPGHVCLHDAMNLINGIRPHWFD